MQRSRSLARFRTPTKAKSAIASPAASSSASKVLVKAELGLLGPTARVADQALRMPRAPIDKDFKKLVEKVQKELGLFKKPDWVGQVRGALRPLAKKIEKIAELKSRSSATQRGDLHDQLDELTEALEAGVALLAETTDIKKRNGCVSSMDAVKMWPALQGIIILYAKYPADFEGAGSKLDMATDLMNIRVSIGGGSPFMWILASSRARQCRPQLLAPSGMPASHSGLSLGVLGAQLVGCPLNVSCAAMCR